MTYHTINKLLIAACFLFATAFSPIPNGFVKNKKFVVVLDAGHGGHDPGNRGNGYKEKEIALNVVLSVGKALEADGRFKVVYTRKTDEFIELHERGSIANKAGADLFVSVHCNSHRSQAFGTETFVLGLHANKENFNVAKNENSVILLEKNYKSNYDGFDPNSPESIIGLTLMQEEYLDQSLTLASFVQESFKKGLDRKSRGVKQAGFVVLHQTYMPSVLIELGFLTNNKEGKYLNSKKGRVEMAKSITKSIITYKESLDAAYTFDEPVPVPVKDSIVVSKGLDIVKKDSLPKVSNVVKRDTLQNEENPIIFKVQISSGNSDLELNQAFFNGLNELSKLNIGGVYKYYFGKTQNYEVVKQLREVAVEKGFPSSFVVAFQKGVPIPLEKAIQQLAIPH